MLYGRCQARYETSIRGRVKGDKVDSAYCRYVENPDDPYDTMAIRRKYMIRRDPQDTFGIQTIQSKNTPVPVKQWRPDMQELPFGVPYIIAREDLLILHKVVLEDL
jgi:hypothetical protein